MAAARAKIALGGINFSVSGWLTAFHLGAAQGLLRNASVTEKTVYAGASGGSLAACAMATGMCPSNVFDVFTAEAGLMRKSGAWYRGGVLDMLSGVLEGLVPPDAHKIVEDRLYVAVQPVADIHKGYPTLINQFDSRQDLLDALITSCFIPFYLNGSMVRSFKNRPHIDGGILHFLPDLTGIAEQPVVNICPLPTWVSKMKGDHVDVGPHLVTDFGFGSAKCIALGFVPPSFDDAIRLRNLGHVAAQSYCTRILAQE